MAVQAGARVRRLKECVWGGVALVGGVELRGGLMCCFSRGVLQVLWSGAIFFSPFTFVFLASVH